MASGSDSPEESIKVTKNDLSCNICYNLLKEAKDLDCPHVFCLQCLQTWVRNAREVTCPECRRVTVIPRGGVSQLKTNLRLKNMSERHPEPLQKQAHVPFCPKHEGERQHFFCVTCGVTVCHNCLVLEHERPRHDIKELKAIAKTQKFEMALKLHAMKQTLMKTKEEENKLTNIERKWQAAKKQAETEVERRVQEVISEAECKGREMKASIEATYQRQFKTLKDKEAHVRSISSQTREVQTAAQNIMDTAADHTYVKQHVWLMDQLKNIPECSQNITMIDLSTLQFVPGSSPMNSSWFGKVHYRGKGTCKLNLIQQFGEFEKAQGVAVNHLNLLAIVDSASEEVTIYENDAGKYRKTNRALGRSNLAGTSTRRGTRRSPGMLVAPVSVAVTSTGKFLVADTLRMHRVQMFSPSCRYEKTINHVGNRITTTPDDMIVIGDSVTGVITAHQADGQLIRTHQVNCHSQQMEGIASNGKEIAFTTGNKGNSVTATDFITGDVIWTVDMICPLGICCEPKSNSLLIAGGSKKVEEHVIHQHCSTTGQLLSRLACRLYNPLGMTVTRESKLVVADWNTIKVFDLQVEEE